jgi:hypothetical protein
MSRVKSCVPVSQGIFFTIAEAGSRVKKYGYHVTGRASDKEVELILWGPAPRSSIYSTTKSLKDDGTIDTDCLVKTVCVLAILDLTTQVDELRSNIRELSGIFGVEFDGISSKNVSEVT